MREAKANKVPFAVWCFCARQVLMPLRESIGDNVSCGIERQTKPSGNGCRLMPFQIKSTSR